MMDKFSSLLKQLKRVGLEDLSTDLEKFSSLLKYVYAAPDTSKEIEVISNVASIVSMLQNMDETDTLPAGASLAPYSIETDKQYIIFNRHPLAGATKRDVMGIGLPNYIDGFVKYFMETRALGMYGNTKSRYLHAAAVLERVEKELKETYNKRYRNDEDDDDSGPQKRRFSTNNSRSAKKAQEDLFKHLERMDRFKTLVMTTWVDLYLGEAAKIKEEAKDSKDSKEPKESKEEAKDNKDPEVLSVNNLKNSDEANSTPPAANSEDPFNLDAAIRSFTKLAAGGEQGVIEELKKLDTDFERITNSVDAKFAEKSNMSVEELRDFVELNVWLREIDTLSKKITKTADFYVPKVDQSPAAQDRHRSEKNNERRMKYQKDQARIDQILKGRFISKESTETGGRKRKRYRLIMAAEIKDSWEIMKQELRTLYSFLIERLIALYQSEETAPQKQIVDKKRSFNTNQKILNDLEGAAKLLGGI